MGLFTKEPAEKKAYWKAFKKAIEKSNEKNFTALEAASSAWPTGWQGYFYMGLCYDLASCVGFDPEKAAGYHEKAKKAAEAAGNDFLEKFYETYAESAINFRLSEDQHYFPRTLKVRQAGAALMLYFDLNENHIMTDILNDRAFWGAVFCGIDTGGRFRSSDEQIQVLYHSAPFRSYIVDCIDRNGSDETRVKNTNEMIDECNELNKVGKDGVTLETAEEYYYVVGQALLMGGDPYLFNGKGWLQNSRINGWEYLWRSANIGFAPALHLMAQLFDLEDFSKEIAYGFGLVYGEENSDRGTIVRQVLALLEEATVRGDELAVRLIDVIAK